MKTYVERNLSQVSGMARTLRESAVREARLPAISEYPIGDAGSFPFRPGRIHHTLRGVHACVNPLVRLAVVPGHPLRRGPLRLTSVTLLLGQVL